MVPTNWRTTWVGVDGALPALQTWADNDLTPSRYSGGLRLTSLEAVQAPA